jgi:hypothetical protein
LRAAKLKLLKVLPKKFNVLRRIERQKTLDLEVVFPMK